MLLFGRGSQARRFVLGLEDDLLDPRLSFRVRPGDGCFSHRDRIEPRVLLRLPREIPGCNASGSRDEREDDYQEDVRIPRAPPPSLGVRHAPRAHREPDVSASYRNVGDQRANSRLCSCSRPGNKQRRRSNVARSASPDIDNRSLTSFRAGLAGPSFRSRM